MQDGAIERTLGPANEGAETPMIVQATTVAKATFLNMASTFQVARASPWHPYSHASSAPDVNWFTDSQ
jgi:hypothetical protein